MALRSMCQRRLPRRRRRSLMPRRVGPGTAGGARGGCGCWRCSAAHQRWSSWCPCAVQPRCEGACALMRPCERRKCGGISVSSRVTSSRGLVAGSVSTRPCFCATLRLGLRVEGFGCSRVESLFYGLGCFCVALCFCAHLAVDGRVDVSACRQWGQHWHWVAGCLASVG